MAAAVRERRGPSLHPVVEAFQREDYRRVLGGPVQAFGGEFLGAAPYSEEIAIRRRPEASVMGRNLLEKRRHRPQALAMAPSASTISTASGIATNSKTGERSRSRRGWRGRRS